MRAKAQTQIFLLGKTLDARYQVIWTNYELLSAPILIMGEKWANFEAYFSYGYDVWYMKKSS